jgi:hypothetical protein
MKRRNSSATLGRPALIPLRGRIATHGRRAELPTITRKEGPSGIRPTSFCGRTLYAAPWIHHTAVHMGKTFQIVCGRKVTVSVDRMKPLYILDGTRHITTNTSSPPAQTNSSPATVATPPNQTPRTTRSGRCVRFLACFNLSYSNPKTIMS